MFSEPSELFRFRFLMRLGLSIVFPFVSIGYGSRARCTLAQQSFLLFLGDGLQIYAKPLMSLVQPTQIVTGRDLQSGFKQLPRNGIDVPV